MLRAGDLVDGLVFHKGKVSRGSELKREGWWEEGERGARDGMAQSWPERFLELLFFVRRV